MRALNACGIEPALVSKDVCIAGDPIGLPFLEIHPAIISQDAAFIEPTLTFRATYEES
ncbi:MAG: hypothetical protein ACR2QH_00515 [Geminicoccaceae bacterium]